MREREQTVNLSRDSKKDIINALHDIRKAIVEEDRKTQSFTENIADSLTSGGSLTQSIRDAIRTETNRETAKLKKALDPLEIVKKITGGSKFATTLAGKALGRSNEDIRKSAGFRVDSYAPEQTRDLPPPPVTPMEKDQAIPLLEQIARSISLITLRVSDIADKMKASKKVELDANGRLRDKVSGKLVGAQEAKSLAEQNTILKEMRDAFIGLRTDEQKREDARKDQARAMGAKQLRTPTVQLDSKGKEVVKPQTIDQNPLIALLGSFTKLSGIIAGVSAALGALLHPVEAFKSVMGAVTKGAEAVKESFSFFGSGEKVSAAVLDTAKAVESGGLASKAVVSGTRIAQKVIPFKKGIVPETHKIGPAPPAPVPETAKIVKPAEKVAEAGVKAAAEVAPKAAAKTTQKTVTKVGKDKIAGILSKKLPSAFSGSSLGKIIPGIGAALGLGFAVSRLVKGDLVGAALEGISGFGGAATAIPAIVAQLVRDVYKDSYGIFPEKDPLSGDRLPELAQIVKDEAASWLQGGKDKKTDKHHNDEIVQRRLAMKNRTPETTPPSIGTKIPEATSKHKELVAMAGTTAGTSTQNPQISVSNIQNMKSSTVLAPGMPSSRSQDSSYLRSLDNALP